MEIRSQRKEEVVNHSGMSTGGQWAAEEAVNHLKEAIASGKHWYIGLLEAMSLWTAPEEVYKGRRYDYVLAGEAFDWLLLAERLCDAVDGKIKEEERERLLLEAEPPLEIGITRFRGLIGGPKYRALLNYWYGVVVEGALLAAVEADIHKERGASGLVVKRDVSGEAYRRIYGASKMELLRAFRMEMGHPMKGPLSVTELKEFTYWLFKYRLAKHDKARVASDTKRGIQQLQAMSGRRRRVSGPPYQEEPNFIDLDPRWDVSIRP